MQPSASIRVPETDLLLERQRHICDCRDEDYDRMKSEVRFKLSKQLANQSLGLPVRDTRSSTMAAKAADGEGSDPYSEYLKKHTYVEDKSDYSNSVSRKESGDISNVHAINDSRRLSVTTSILDRIQRRRDARLLEARRNVSVLQQAG